MLVLVVEDTKKHLEDARAYSAQLTGCTVHFATNLMDAMRLLQEHGYDGVISDVFFPAEAGGSLDTFKNALVLSAKLAEMGIHHVFNTAANHHGMKFRGFGCKSLRNIFGGDKDYYFIYAGMVVETYPEDSETEVDTKQWQAAFRYILLVQALSKLPDKGASIVQEARLKPFAWGDRGQLTKEFETCVHPFILQTFQAFNA